MASVDASVSFNGAVKHLFRHLHDAQKLRRNPIARRFFKPASTARIGAVEERDSLSYIHELVRKGAAICRDLDIASGKQERGLRLYKIITLQCLAQHALSEVAQELGISAQHCYRERASACIRVAHYIVERSASPATEYFPDLDEFQLLVDHARNRASSSDERDATRACKELLSAATSKLQKLEALRVSALVSMQFGDLTKAKAFYTSAKALASAEPTSTSPSKQDIALAHVELLGYSLARHDGRGVDALRFAKRATDRLEPYRARGPANVRELFTESLSYVGACFWSLGNTDLGYDCISRAEQSLQYVRHTFPFSARILAGVWKLRNYLSVNCKSWYPSWQRLNGLTAAFELAYAAGLISEAVETLVIMTEHHAFAGNDAEALRIGRLALLLAKQLRSNLLRVQTTVEIAARLMMTRHWKFAARLASATERPENLDAYHGDLLMYIAAEQALKHGDFLDAWNIGSANDSRGPWTTLAMRGRVVAAAAAHALGREREALDIVDSVVSAAESLNTTPLLHDAYRLAAEITGERKFKTKATEVGRLLSA